MERCDPSPRPADPATALSPADRLEAWLAPTWIETGTGFPHGSHGSHRDRQPAAGDHRVVDSVGAVTITESLLTGALAFAQFLAGRRFTPEHAAEARAATLADFTARPHETVTELVEIDAAATRIPELSPIVRARLRRRALNRIATHRPPGSPASPTVAIIQRYNPVVARTADGELVVTDDAVLAWGQLRELAAAVAGVRFEWNAAELRASIDDSFQRWPEARQRDLAEAHPSLITTKVGLRQLGEAERAGLADTIAHQVTGPQSIEVAAIALGHIGRVHDLIGVVRSRSDAA